MIKIRFISWYWPNNDPSDTIVISLISINSVVFNKNEWQKKPTRKSGDKNMPCLHALTLYNPIYPYSLYQKLINWCPILMIKIKMINISITIIWAMINEFKSLSLLLCNIANTLYQLDFILLKKLLILIDLLISNLSILLYLL